MLGLTLLAAAVIFGVQLIIGLYALRHVLLTIVALALLLGLGAVALLVGGIGVANTMVISVLERRAEIGLRRSLGATRGQIRVQFVAESLLLSLAGGAGGSPPAHERATMDTDFYRVKRLPPYVIAEVNAMRAAARAEGRDIIDLGMGNPDLPPPQHVIDKLVETAGKPRTDRYSASKGIAGLRRAQAGYYARRFGVKLNPDTQVVATLGSKEGFANMAQAITAPGDVVLVPNPSYPIHAFGFLMAGGVIRSLPAEPTRTWLDPAETVGRRVVSPEWC